jgi:hypothetical protein
MQRAPAAAGVAISIVADRMPLESRISGVLSVVSICVASSLGRRGRNTCDGRAACRETYQYVLERLDCPSGTAGIWGPAAGHTWDSDPQQRATDCARGQHPRLENSAVICGALLWKMSCAGLLISWSS